MLHPIVTRDISYAKTPALCGTCASTQSRFAFHTIGYRIFVCVAFKCLITSQCPLHQTRLQHALFDVSYHISASSRCTYHVKPTLEVSVTSIPCEEQTLAHSNPGECTRVLYAGKVEVAFGGGRAGLVDSLACANMG